MKLTIECTDEQAQIIIDCLEEALRFRMQQPNGFLEHILEETYPDKEKCGDGFGTEFQRWCNVRKCADISAMALMNIVYGVGTKDTTVEALRICDIWTAIRHEKYMATAENIDEWCVMADKPLHRSDYPMIKVEVEK